MRVGNQFSSTWKIHSSMRKNQKTRGEVKLKISASDSDGLSGERAMKMTKRRIICDNILIATNVRRMFPQHKYSSNNSILIEIYHKYIQCFRMNIAWLIFQDKWESNGISDRAKNHISSISYYKESGLL